MVTYKIYSPSEMDMLEEGSGQRHRFFVRRLNCERGIRRQLPGPSGYHVRFLISGLLRVDHGVCL